MALLITNNEFEEVVDCFLKSLKKRMIKANAQSFYGGLASVDEIDHMNERIKDVWMEYKNNIPNVLSEEELELSGIFDEITKDYVNKFIINFKKIKKDAALSPSDPNIYGNKFFYIDNVDLPKKVKNILKEVETKIWFLSSMNDDSYGVSGSLHRRGYKGNYIRMRLSLPYSYSFMKINDYSIAISIGGLFRHELEHLLDKAKGYKTAAYSESSIAEAFMYYTSDSEVNAYVTGLCTNAKIKKIITTGDYDV